VTLLFVAVADHGAVHRLDAILFLVIYFVFTAYVVGLVRGRLTPTEKEQLAAESTELAEGKDRPPRLWPSIGFLVAGVILLSLGAESTVSGAVELGRMFGLSERVIGLTIVAAGTGLPEVVTSLVSSVRGRDDVALGNVIGSNLFNILGILGINGLIRPLPIAPEIAQSDNYWMLGFTVVLFPLMYTGLRINRWEGGGLLFGYVAYTVLLLSR
jgi:cation:H+ antiporter